MRPESETGRRRLLTFLGGALAMFGLARSAQANAADATPVTRESADLDRLAAAAARQEIMELRHAYGMATDLIGSNKDENVAAGLAIYRRIFIADARIGAAGIDPVGGPDAWAGVVRKALAPYAATQHLIGTQQVTDLQMPDPNGVGGSARMTSYLQAWHSTAEGDLWLYMGTYEDELVHGEGSGWQIARMMLHQTAADYRKLGRAPGG